METNNILSMHRILLLYKQYINLHSKNILITIGAAFILIAAFHVFVHWDVLSAIKYGNNYSYGHTEAFVFAFIAASLLWTSQAFPGFRSKEKTMKYLILPASVQEKFIFEFLLRIIFFLLVFPLVYWLAANSVNAIFQSYNEGFVAYKFHFSLLHEKLNTREIILSISLGFLLLTLPFAGATYFQKLSLVKTILSVALIFGFFTLMILLIVKGFNIKEYSPMDNKILFMKDEKDAQLAGIYAAVLGNLVILAIGYFKLKEKEA